MACLVDRGMKYKKPKQCNVLFEPELEMLFCPEGLPFFKFLTQETFDIFNSILQATKASLKGPLIRN